MDDLIVFDFVELRIQFISVQSEQGVSYLYFQRFNALRIECSCCKAEICELYVACTVHQEVLHRQTTPVRFDLYAIG